MKWSINWAEYGQSPPSLLNVLISMFMSPGTYTEPGRVFPGQEYVQLLLLLVAVGAVPILLLPKPILFLMDQKKAKAEAEEGASYRAMAADGAMAPVEEGGTAAAHEEEEGEFGEVMVHQVRCRCPPLEPTQTAGRHPPSSPTQPPG